MESKTVDINVVISKVINGRDSRRKITDALKQLETKDHAVMSKRLRRDKIVKTEDGDTEVKVNRIPIALQKIIVSRAASFLVGQPIQLLASIANETDQKLLDMIKKTWNDNKLDFRSKKIAKIMMSETECAEIWYAEDVDREYWGDLGNTNGESTKRMRMKLVHPKAGDMLYPVFDDMNNLTAFGRGYFKRDENNKKIERFDLYTKEIIYYTVKKDGKWVPIDEDGVQENEMEKIPVIYYSQDQPEWADVQQAIERLETLLSNFADTNDYFGSPLIKVTGDVQGFAKKGEQGKVLKLKDGAKAEYLTWDAAPTAIKLEIETLFDVIYSMTQTPNITFKEVKGLGALSGVALNLLFTDAQLKAKDKQEDVFGECIQRRTNFIKATCLEINTSLSPSKSLQVFNKFGSFKIDNTTEEIENLITATGGKPIMSVKTAMELNPLVEDIEQEQERMDEEAEATTENSLIP